MTPIQTWLSRYLTAVDNSGLPQVYINSTRPRGGVLGAIEYLQSLTAEGVTRNFLAAYATPQGTPTNPPVDADLAAAGSNLTAAQFLSLVYTIQSLNAQLTALNNGVTIMSVLYAVRQ